MSNFLVLFIPREYEPDGYCGNCGTALFDDETVLCNDCLQDKWYEEDQDFYDSWYNQEGLDNG